MRDLEKTYSNADLTILWKPNLCAHSAKCWRGTTGLPEVFDPKKRPWIDLTGGDSGRIRQTVEACPSGALSLVNQAKIDFEQLRSEAKLMPDGPLIFIGAISLTHADGRVEERVGKTAFCRCGASANKPFCDGSHRDAGFKG